MNQAAWDAMILNLARRDVDVRTGEFWKRRRDTADLMARISRVLERREENGITENRPV